MTAIPKAALGERKARSFWYLEQHSTSRLDAKPVLGGAFHAPLVDFNQSYPER